MHYGTPLWMKNSYSDPDYPSYVERYTENVIERYGKYLQYIVPYNEPHTVAEFAGNKGVWPPYLNGYDGYLSVMKAVVLGAQRQTKLIQEHGIKTVQVECSGGSFALGEKTRFLSQWETTAQSMYFDLLIGKVERLAPFFAFLEKHGWDEAAMSRFQDNPAEIGIMGINFYPQFSFQDVGMDTHNIVTRQNHLLWAMDLERIIRTRYRKYSCPIIVTETSIRGDVRLKEKWLRESIAMVTGLVKEGLPILGYTWFPIIDMVDWEYRTNEGTKENYMARFGFWDEHRKENSCASLYHDLVREYRGDN
jgi:beta-glucosidase/6-phospho-beta-glucosidase/beta-galactosidase